MSQPQMQLIVPRSTYFLKIMFEVNLVQIKSRLMNKLSSVTEFCYADAI